MYAHPIDCMNIHFLCYGHGKECIETHDGIRNTFGAIVWDAGFHMGREQLHGLLSTTFNSFCWWVDIVFTKYDICILVDIVIVDPTRTDLLP